MDIKERELVVLHVGCIQNSNLDGVSVVVPQHVINQGKYARVAFINVNNIIIPSLNCQFKYNDKTILNNLKQPFNNPNIVVFHEIYRKQYIKITKELVDKKIPYVIIPHGELNRSAQKRKWFKKALANFLIFGKIANQAIGVQCLSKRELDNTILGRKKFIATNGINIPKMRKKNYSVDNYEFIYIGRIDVYHKGIDLMIEAFAQYVKDNPGAKLRIYGPMDSKNKAIADNIIRETNCSSSVSIHDAVAGSMKEEILVKASAFIQTSRFEGMPMGILEALSYGIPCIVTEGTTLGQFVERNECGISCMNTVESICNGIEKFTNNSNNIHEIMGDNARRAIVDNFRWDKIAKDTLEIYKKMLFNV